MSAHSNSITQEPADTTRHPGVDDSWLELTGAPRDVALEHGASKRGGKLNARAALIDAGLDVACFADVELLRSRRPFARVRFLEVAESVLLAKRGGADAPTAASGRPS